SASGTVLIPSWSPFSATSRTSGAVISRLMRCDLSSAMSEKLLNTLKKRPRYCAIASKPAVSARARPPMLQNFIGISQPGLAARRVFRCKARKQRIDRHGAQVLAGTGANRDPARLHFLVADDKLVG